MFLNRGSGKEIMIPFGILDFGFGFKEFGVWIGLVGISESFWVQGGKGVNIKGEEEKFGKAH